MTHHEISVQGRLLRIVAGVALLGTEATFLSGHASAQEIDFGQINKFESLTTGTLRVGAPAKTIIDDGERHVVILTIWDAEAETKAYWTPLDGSAAKTTIIPGKGTNRKIPFDIAFHEEVCRGSARDNCYRIAYPRLV